MLNALMISRRYLLATCLGAAAFLTQACERSPLLAPSGSTITLQAGSTSLGPNQTTQIIAQVIEPSGTPPHSGTQLVFTTTLGRIEPSEIETDSNGRATVLFNPGGASGVATISAISGGVSTGANGSIKIAVGAAAVGRVTVDANPSTVTLSNPNTTITAFVFDAGGNALNGVPVSFTTDAGTISASTANSDATGRAQTTLSTTKTAKVTATSGIASGSGTSTTAAPSATVTVNVNAPSTISFGSGTPTTAVVGTTVTFPLTYGTTGTPVTQVTVDFGDGTVQTTPGAPSAVSHAFTRSGSFLVRVTGTDSFGDTSNASTSITIAALTGKISVAPAAPTAGAVVTFTLDVTPANTQLQSVTWSFGDGTGATLPGNATIVQHRYATGGARQVTASFIDVNGSPGQASTLIEIQ
jgi:hypothetical protein